MTDLGRQVFQCCHCGRSIKAHHNLASHNLRKHEKSCVEQEKVKASKMHRRALRRAAQAARTSGVGSTVVPGKGQLGMPFDGIPAEVVS